MTTPLHYWVEYVFYHPEKNKIVTVIFGRDSCLVLADKKFKFYKNPEVMVWGAKQSSFILLGIV